ncbi:MAG: asparagine synthase (glutamine-hydrolyzing) [Candidatus Omnitrophica bacterium CG12_big_fil_rev_8_21_14_0_65_43_15]|uniref:asparagine synthase (glutamine-hydrolyzing) n=1 Tax=Candidatus Taenaricola geysiri TaxID=1974752 RepID=A0A2J0LMS2_9BACT|nr:MAG: asparagine synthase (glutamine-hydrolyzing) [Candidatus Omnitrophica bacterium CG1_02_43_210]PIV11850.1 MAG: asparagine synthase (glutamine-hydrolyzing) [Candidatus Omnitrophica bacterium CG03_land_8_20_14_0_80_43_22]PIV39902.1 MAG: asparagine synthase (glutamine-hydrolyzing) [Candidatus Omnitrophica bacterium CG02_land_8_20_14_3_00__42_8]PIW66873.1 MAG: asparagine synthase (glutamine-hydrolyzing) [Candidatus Omnitrophica bacterium CG12_big_fil_rev_8_21_14_0_65_43_15]PIW80297.1 MAG: asp
MCGICGKININNPASPVTEGLIRSMCGVLKHRGPDDSGIYINGAVGLGHSRLSIIDLSPAGRQPMSNEDNTLWLVLNGEIYNFIELRKGLEAKGHKFKSHTDTEVILHLYEEKGVDCLKDLRGMFAFALWDEKRKSLFLARDRVGKKPLCYANVNGSFLFASEMKSILQDPDVKADVDLRMIPYYLTYGYTPSPCTMFKGIKKLQPAHYLLYQKGNIEIKRYWQLDFSKKTVLDEKECAAQVLVHLEEAVKVRLISDVPLGAFLSGGIDSSAVVAMMARNMSKPVKTFSVGFEEASHSELSFARIVAKAFGTDHREYIVKPDAMHILPKLIWHYNEPYADSSALPSFYVAKMTRQDVTVALNGDGGDENFAGYIRYMATRVSEKVPHGISKAMAFAFRNGLNNTMRSNRLFSKIIRFASVASQPTRERYYNWIIIFRDREKEFLYTDSFKKMLQHENPPFSYMNGLFEACAGLEVVDSLLYADINSYLPEDLLVKMDIASMANSLEARSPFLDHKFMEFCASVPSGLKIKRGVLKYILKKSLNGILPDEILRRGKMGFGVPIDNWFRKELKNYCYEILLSDKCVRRGFFRKEYVKKILDDQSQYKSNSGDKIWALLNLELWHRIFIDKENIL